jgi:hypothetical protein
MLKKKYGITDVTGATEDGSTPDSGSGGNGAGMGTMDWVGIGMQLAGAMANQKEEDQKKQLEQSRYNTGLQLNSRSRTDTLQQNAIENQQRNRTQNQSGLNYLTGLVDSNTAASRQSVPSFRKTMLYGGI